MPSMGRVVAQNKPHHLVQRGHSDGVMPQIINATEM